MVLNVHDQPTLVHRIDLRNSVSDKVLRGVDGEGPNDDEGGEHGQREPLVF